MAWKDAGDTAVVVLEDLYHTVWTCLCAKEIVLDTFHRYKPKNGSGHIACCIVLFVLHACFLSKDTESSAVPRKLVYLTDLLFHVMCIAWDVLVATAFFRCPTGTCPTSPFTIFVSVVYHFTTLCTYYRWFTVVPSDKQPCLFGMCAGTFRVWRQRRLAKLQQSVQVEREISGGGRCSATFEFSQHGFETSASESRILASRDSVSSEVLVRQRRTDASK